MAIDSKLAHGLAGNSFRSVMEMSSGVINLLSHLFSRQQTPASTPKGARKLIANAKPYINCVAFQVLERETNREGPAIHWIFLRPENGAGDLYLDTSRYAPISTICTFDSKKLVIFKKHAIARMHQRLDQATWIEIEVQMRVAMIVLLPMLEATKRLMFKQFFLPTKDGLFVGEVRTDGLPQLNTYLHYDRLSARWQRVCEVIQGFMNLLDEEPELLFWLIDGLMTGVDPKADPSIMWFTEELTRPEYAWLCEPYSPRESMEETIWDAAKVAIADAD